MLVYYHRPAPPLGAIVFQCADAGHDEPQVQHSTSERSKVAWLRSYLRIGKREMDFGSFETARTRLVRLPTQAHQREQSIAAASHRLRPRHLPELKE